MRTSPSSLLAVTIAAALFGRRNRDRHGELDASRGGAVDGEHTGGGRSAEAAVDAIDGAFEAFESVAEPPPPAEGASDDVESVVDGDSVGMADATDTTDGQHPLLDDAQIEALRARQASIEPTPHPVRPHELWHPTIDLGPVGSAASPSISSSSRPAPIGSTRPDPSESRSRVAPVIGRLREIRADGPVAGPSTDPAPRGPLGSGGPPLMPGESSGSDLVRDPVGRSREMGGRGVRGVLPVLGMTPDDLDHDWIRGTVEPTAGADGRYDDVQVTSEPTAGTRSDGDGATSEPDEPAADGDLFAAGDAPGASAGASAAELAEEPAVAAPDTAAAGAGGVGPVAGAARPLSLVPSLDEDPAPVGDPRIVDADEIEDPGDAEHRNVYALPNGLGDATAAAPEIPDTYLAVRPLWIEDDGTVPIGEGTIRVANPSSTSAREVDGRTRVEIGDGWCWISGVSGEDGVVVSFTSEPEEFTVSPGTTALAAMDDDGSRLLAVLSGEATLVHPVGRIRLRSGALALLDEGREPQVDIASDEELRSDPIIARNLALDEP